MARKTTSATQKITAFMELNPDARPAQIAKALKIPVVRVYSVRSKLKKEANMDAELDVLSLYAVKSLHTRVAEGRRAHLEAKPKSLWDKVVGWFK